MKFQEKSMKTPFNNSPATLYRIGKPVTPFAHRSRLGKLLDHVNVTSLRGRVYAILTGVYARRKYARTRALRLVHPRVDVNASLITG